MACVTPATTALAAAVTQWSCRWAEAYQDRLLTRSVADSMLLAAAAACLLAVLLLLPVPCTVTLPSLRVRRPWQGSGLAASTCWWRQTWQRAASTSTASSWSYRWVWSWSKHECVCVCFGGVCV